MMPSWLLLLALLSAGPPDEGFPVRGRVVDPAGAPLVGVMVSVDSMPAAQATTSADGQFVIEHVPAGSHRLRAARAGFAAWEGLLQVPRRSDAPGPVPDVRVMLMPRAVAERVTVTAARGSARVETAAPISVLTSTDLQLGASPALDDALRIVPGFSLFRRASSRLANPTTQGATLRGLSASGASRALVLADGTPLNDPFGGWVYWNRVPQAAIERVEVVRGGGSDLYGADALAGVIQVLTAEPRTGSLRATAETASHGTPRASLFGGMAANGWSGSLGAEGSRTDGTWVVAEEERGAVDARAGGDYRTVQAAGAFAASSGWRLRGSANAFGESRRNGTPLQTNSTGLWQARLEAGGPLAGGHLEAFGHAGTQEYWQSFSSIAAGRSSETLTVRQYVPASQYGAGVTWRRVVGTADLLAGLETREVVATSEEIPYLASGVARATTAVRGFQRSSGAFGQVRVGIDAKTTVVAGARADLWQGERGGGGDGVFSPRLSVSRRVSETMTLRGSVTSSFRAPTLNERYRGFRVGNVQTLANAQLRPERLVTGEAGALLEIGRASVRLAAFCSDLDAAITNVTVSTTPQLITRRRDNAGAVHARGLEVDAEYRWSPSLSLTGTVALTRARFVDTPALSRNRVPQVPSWQSAAGLRWLAPAAVALHGQVRAFGDQFEDDRNTLVLRRGAIADVSVSRALTRQASVFVAVENLFDTEYDTGRTPARTIGMPRTAHAGVRVFLP